MIMIVERAIHPMKPETVVSSSLMFTADRCLRKLVFQFLDHVLMVNSSALPVTALVIPVGVTVIRSVPIFRMRRAVHRVIPMVSIAQLTASHATILSALIKIGYVMEVSLTMVSMRQY